jgi:hypothetical protein
MTLSLFRAMMRKSTAIIPVSQFITGMILLPRSPHIWGGFLPPCKSTLKTSFL